MGASSLTAYEIFLAEHMLAGYPSSICWRTIATGGVARRHPNLTTLHYMLLCLFVGVRYREFLMCVHQLWLFFLHFLLESLIVHSTWFILSIYAAPLFGYRRTSDFSQAKIYKSDDNDLHGLFTWMSIWFREQGRHHVITVVEDWLCILLPWCGRMFVSPTLPWYVSSS